MSISLTKLEVDQIPESLGILLRSDGKNQRKTSSYKSKYGSRKFFEHNFEVLRNEIKANISKQLDMYINNLVGDITTNRRDFHVCIYTQKKDTPCIPPLVIRNGIGVTDTEAEQAGN